MNAVVEEVVAPAAPLTVSQIMAQMFRIRAARAELAVKEKELVAEWEAFETQLLGKLDEQGSVRVSSLQGTASVSEQILPLVEDWDAYYAYIKENDAWHLLQRRPAVNAYREMVEAALAAHPAEDQAASLPDRLAALPPVIPNTRPIVKKSINLRAGT